MLHTSRQTANPSNVLSVIMGGGQGTRLFPLTKERAKPAVPLAGKYRLVDIPISNCINSGLRRIYLLTQFNSASLHRHIAQSYKFAHFTGGFVEILAAAPTYADTSWYQGTADAVRKNLIHFMNHEWEYLLILSGDALYRMDFRRIIEQHKETNADITVATIPVGRSEMQTLGIMQIDAERRITRFVEKPKDPALQDSLKLPREWHDTLGIQGEGELFLASMGIYVFNREVIRRLLDNTLTDFGKHIIPTAIQNLRVFSFVFQGYWEDIGTIRAFFDANIDVTNELPRFNFFDEAAKIFSRPRFLPASKINGAGLRSSIGAGSVLNRVILLGNDYYEAIESIVEHEKGGQPPIGIGTNCRIENTIVDKNARIGNNVVISPAGKPDKVDHTNYYIRDGIVIIPKNGIVPHGMVI